MRYQRLGDSNLQVSEVCLGTMTFGRQNTQDQAHAQLNLAFESGVNFIDTAEMYPVPADARYQGATEEIVGNWLAGRRRDEVVLASKVVGRSSMRWIRDGGGLDRDNIHRAVETSLKRLQTDYLDLYQIHWPDRYVPMFGPLEYDCNQYKAGTTPILETMETMAELMKQGKIRHYGVSNETPWGLCRYVNLAAQHGLPKPVSIQNAYSLLNRVFDIHLAEVSHVENIPLLPYSVLGFGFLTGKYRNGALPQGSRYQLFPEYPKRYAGKPNMEAAVDAYAQLAAEHGLTAMALQFAASRPFVGSVIVGATSAQQLADNLAALANPLPQDLVAGINNIHLTYPNPCP